MMLRSLVLVTLVAMPQYSAAFNPLLTTDCDKFTSCCNSLTASLKHDFINCGGFSDDIGCLYLSNDTGSSVGGTLGTIFALIVLGVIACRCWIWWCRRRTVVVREPESKDKVITNVVVVDKNTTSQTAPPPQPVVYYSPPPAGYHPPPAGYHPPPAGYHPPPPAGYPPHAAPYPHTGTPYPPAQSAAPATNPAPPPPYSPDTK